MNEELDLFANPISAEEYGSLLKALAAGQNTTVVDGTFGVAQPQSMENTLIMLTASESELTLWQDIPKTATKQLVEEYGLVLGHGESEAFVDQAESPQEIDPVLERNFASVKYAREQWRVNDVAGMVTSIQPAEVISKRAGTLRLLRNVNRKLYSGNPALVSQQYIGVETAIRSNGSADHVIDVRGEAPGQRVFDDSAELIRSNFGNVKKSVIYTSPGGRNTLAQILKRDVASIQRVTQGDVTKQDGMLQIGNGVDGVYTNYGFMPIKDDLYIAAEYEQETLPSYRDPSDPRVRVPGPTSTRAPATPSFALGATGAPVAGSKWANTGVRPGGGGNTYQYQVAAGNRWGLSAAAAIQVSGAAPVAGQDITVTITPGAGGSYPATYYVIYSTAVSGSGDFRAIGKIAANGITPVVFADLNLRIPGTTNIFVICWGSAEGEDRTAAFKRLAPLYNKPLAATDMTKRGILNLFGMPIWYTPLRMVIITNVPIGVKSKSVYLTL